MSKPQVALVPGRRESGRTETHVNVSTPVPACLCPAGNPITPVAFLPAHLAQADFVKVGPALLGRPMPAAWAGDVPATGTHGWGQNLLSDLWLSTGSHSSKAGPAQTRPPHCVPFFLPPLITTPSSLGLGAVISVKV